MSPRRNSITYSQNPNRAARQAHARGDKAFRTYDTSHIRPKRNPIPTIIGIVALALILGAVVWGIVTFLRGCSSTEPKLAVGDTVQIIVEEGEGTRSVANKLVDAGLLTKASEFNNRVAALGAENTIQPGVYTLTGGMTVDQILTTLQTPVPSVMFTIPEGYTIAQIAQVVSDVTEGRISVDEFKAQASNASVYAGKYPFLEEVGTNSLEGYLFPKTYPITDQSTADTVIRMMLDQFVKETAGLSYQYATEHGLTRYDVVKLASIIERETDDSYRSTVSSVLYNRLAIDMMLQADATLAYVLGGEPTPEDLKSDNPYNTYTHYGLPPTPIGSPSLDSLQAACAPEKTDYLYFYIAPDETGTVQHYFSVTYEEHQGSWQ